jgi:hypothetical protein
MPVHPGRMVKRELAARDMPANRIALSLCLPYGLIQLVVLERER